MGACCVKGNPKPESKQSGQSPALNRDNSKWIFPAEDKIKENIREKYKIGDQLGQPGQFGTAWLCTRKEDSLTFAVKEIKKNRFLDAMGSGNDEIRTQFFQQFRDEIEIMRQMKHPNIVQLVEVFEGLETLWLVMEKCSGGELFDRIKSKKKYSEKDAAAVLREFAKGIEALHKQHIAHCDLKPDNILFLNSDDDSPLKIIDFGMSKHSPPGGDKISGFRGTPYYVAPEIVSNKEYRFHCDMWSFGVISFVMLFGFPPFHSRQGKDEEIYEKIKLGFQPKTKAGYGAWFPETQEISPAAKELISRCLETDPVKRYTATEVLEHPWVTGQAASDEPLVGQVMKNLNEFTAGCKLKAAVLDLMTDIMTDAEIVNLKKTFHAIDEDGDGQITADELKKAVDKQVQLEEKGERNQQQTIEIKNFEKVIQLADINGDGQLSYKELLATSVSRKMKLKSERMVIAFEKFDIDNDGFITKEELKQILSSPGYEIAESELNKIIKEVDKDKDGQINKDEFLAMWKTRQKNYMNSLLGDEPDLIESSNS